MSVTLTNKLNLPQQIVNACLHDTHKVAGDISVSQLIENPRVIHLKRNNNYSEDVSDRLYMLMGTALHHILERSNMGEVEKRAFMMVTEVLKREAEKIKDDSKREGVLKVQSYLTKFMNFMFPESEKRFLYEVTQRMEIGDRVLYGTPDLFDIRDGILYDYKYCSVYSYMYPESRMKWDAQTNVYAYMLTQAGYEVKEIRIVAFFRDYSQHGFQKSKDYPDSQIKEISIKVRSASDMATYITNRMNMHVKAEETGILPYCSGKERWASSDQYAIVTPGSKKALRVFDIKPMAEKFMLEFHHKYEDMEIKFRPGVSTKCERFCPVRDFCDQYKTYREALLKAADDE